MHPDDFLVQIIDNNTDKTCETIRTLRMELKNPPINAKQYLAKLEKQSLTKTVKKLNGFLDLL